MVIAQPDTYEITGKLKISRILTGLWQVADMEKDGDVIDPEKGADYLEAYARDGFTTFDMADHYGSAEIISGHLLKRYASNSEKPLVFTKWCPPPGLMTKEVVLAGVVERLQRLGIDKIDLLQFHWWTFEHPAWLDALHELNELREQGLIGEIGVTNFDAAHLHLAMTDGIPIRTNQVSFSLIDRRACGDLAELCRQHNVHLLAYGTLCGGFLSEKWLGKAEPKEILDWSSMKYKRFIDTAGGWEIYQSILEAASSIASKYDVSISNVATRWVLEQSGVAGVIIGARIGEREHRADNVRLFSFSLSDEDYALLDKAFEGSGMIPGDCGDEYRKPPFLTASGDLTDHLNEVPKAFVAEDIPGRKNAKRVLSGSKWENIAGYCRAQRIGDRILVSGTTATAGQDRVVSQGDAAAQTTFILDTIEGAVAALGGSMEDVVRTRVYVANGDDALAVSKAHLRKFGAIKPANTLLEIGSLVGDYLVEIEAEALVD
ncbi:MAG: aldo/keto reductase [Desulfofustis sp.]|nr:aldo/keto reductase [Desulfofustis sp.]